MDKFELLKTYTKLIIDKDINSLICCGESGFGKTFTISSTLKEYNVNYIMVKGFSTAKALYELLYDKKDMLIVFDDCDSILKDKTALNILKGALDSYNTRVISWLASNNIKNYPITFEFQGQIIFISNLKLSEMDKALKSRALTIDMFLSKNDKIKIYQDMLLNDNLDIVNQLKILNVITPYIENENINIRTIKIFLNVYKKTKDLKLFQTMIKEKAEQNL